MAYGRRYAFGKDGMVGVRDLGPTYNNLNWYPEESAGYHSPLGKQHEKTRSQSGGRSRAKKDGGGINVDSNWKASQDDAKQGWKEKNQRKQGREDMVFQAMLERKQREHEAALESREQQRKMKMLSGLMGGNRGGFEEQIFNNAGAPQVVRLNKDNSTQFAQIMAQMLGR